MLGRKDDTREEYDHGRAAVDRQLIAADFERLRAAFFAELERKFR